MKIIIAIFLEDAAKESVSFNGTPNLQLERRKGQKIKQKLMLKSKNKSENNNKEKKMRHAKRRKSRTWKESSETEKKLYCLSLMNTR